MYTMFAAGDGAEVAKSAMETVIAAMTDVFTLSGTVVTEITKQPILLFCLAAGLVPVGIGIFARLKNAARFSCGFAGASRPGLPRAISSSPLSGNILSFAPSASRACLPFCVFAMTRESPVSSSFSGQSFSAPHRSAMVISDG